MNFYTSYEGTGKIVFHAPHGGIFIPEHERSLFLTNDTQLEEEHLRMVDRFTGDMVRSLSSLIDASFFENHLSRLVCDPERFIGNGEEMESVGMGFAYTHGHQRQEIRALSEFDKDRILKSYYEPYADSFTDLVDNVLDREGTVFILDIHSYASQALPYELHGDGERPEICIGFDTYHVRHEIIEMLTSVFGKNYTVGVNSPFSGSYVPLKHYGKNPKVSSVMLEIRRDIYMDEGTGLMIQENYYDLIDDLKEACDALIDISD